MRLCFNFSLDPFYTWLLPTVRGMTASATTTD